MVERHRQVWGRHNSSPGPRSLVRLARAELALSRMDPGNAGVLVMGYPGHADMAVAKRIADGRPVVFNPLVSLADTFVDDRAVVSGGSPLAVVLRGLDRSAFRRADLVVADTETHAACFETRSTCPRSRSPSRSSARRTRVPARGDGATRVPCPVRRKADPAARARTILAAARLVHDVPFVIAGEGQLAHGSPTVPRTSSTSRRSNTASFPMPTGVPAARSASSASARRRRR